MYVIAHHTHAVADMRTHARTWHITHSCTTPPPSLTQARAPLCLPSFFSLSLSRLCGRIHRTRRTVLSPRPCLRGGGIRTRRRAGGGAGEAAREGVHTLRRTIPDLGPWMKSHLSGTRVTGVGALRKSAGGGGGGLTRLYQVVSHVRTSVRILLVAMSREVPVVRRDGERGVAGGGVQIWECDVRFGESQPRPAHARLGLCSLSCCLTLSPTISPTDPVSRGQLWPTGSVGAGHRASRR